MFLHMKTAIFFFLPKMDCTLVQQLKYPHPQKDKKNHTEHKYKG